MTPSRGTLGVDHPAAVLNEKGDWIPLPAALLRVRELLPSRRRESNH